jgi:putative DNA primase/helicase
MISRLADAFPATSTDCLAAALAYAARGWRVLPVHCPRFLAGGAVACSCDRGECDSVGKHPIIAGWTAKATTDADVIRGWWQEWPDANVGILTGPESRIVVLDVDLRNGGFEALGRLCDEHGQLPETFEVFSGGGGRHCYFKHPGRRVPSRANALGPGLDVKGDGGLVVAPPSLHASGDRYRAAWEDGKLPDMPDWLLTRVITPDPGPARTATPPSNGHGEVGNNWVRKALARVTANNRNDVGFWLAQQLRDDKLTEAEAAAIMRDYVERVPDGGHPYTEAEAMASLAQAFAKSPREPARSVGGSRPSHALRDLLADAPEQSAKAETLPARPRLTDPGNANRFVEQHGRDVRFCYPTGQFLVYDGPRWQHDEKGNVLRRGIVTVERIFRESRNTDNDAVRAKLLEHAVKSQRRERIVAMIELAKPALAILPADLDRDPLLLNVQNGTIDLRTGRLRPHRREDYQTKVCRARYVPGTPAPVWLAFLDRIFRTHPALVPYVQKAIGYCLTGLTIEQVLFFAYGLGANGKTTLFDAMMYVLGDYGGKADRELLTAHDGAHPTNIADLMGRRCVICSETNEGGRFNEAKLKDLAGETKLKARKMRQDFFEFDATHKLWLYSNHKPLVRGTDFGFWRRMRLIPFVETIGEDEKDPALLEKLKAEADGILAWLVEGCLLWQSEGLGLPDEVAEATNVYRQEMDSIGAFLAEYCQFGAGLEASAKHLYAAYCAWCAEAGENPFSQKRLGAQLRERGLENERETFTGRKVWRGVGLKTGAGTGGGR